MADPAEKEPDRGRFLRGAFCAATAVSIWAGWIVVMRLGVTSSLAAADIAAIRFAVAGLLLLPVVLRRGLARDRLGSFGLIALIAGGGAPFVLTVGAGLRFAPAAHAGALVHGVFPFFVALLAWTVLKEPFSRMRLSGFALMLAGVLAIVGVTVLTAGHAEGIGHLFFLCAALLWACYTVALRRARLSSLHAVAIVSVATMAVYLPVYGMFLPNGLANAPVGDIVFQAFYQGVLTMIVSLVLYGWAVNLLGASGAAAFGALGPAMAALIAIPVLGEYPAPIVWVGILLICVGVYLGGGGRVPAKWGGLRPGRTGE